MLSAIRLNVCLAIFASLWLIAASEAIDLSKRQSLSDIPTCAQLCLATAFTAINHACTQTDLACLCKNPTFKSSSTSCYSTSCSTADNATAQAWGIKACASAGVNIMDTANTSNNSSSNSGSNTASVNSTNASTHANSAAAIDAHMSITSLLIGGFIVLLSFTLA
ncbi:hypothetical protein O181_096713 [Austropuccinia psidii MF-1]|uniref:CFEM domain-containing protein n=1 Tax=Austropuccinia psidii MF-1 TaxID=1389203 RepID=A0A9Q3PCG1_9BASI|nr:hypothetical protein [Austropuccinia psidii MF-1]